MPQYAYPTSDAVRDGWTTLAGGTTNLYAGVDDPSSVDTSDGITYLIPAAVGGDPSVTSGDMRFGMASLSDSLTDADHYLEVWADAAGTGNHNLRCEIYSGGFLIQTEVLSVSPSRPTEAFSRSIPGASVTSYSSLQLRFQGVIEVAFWRANVYRARIRVPNVGFDHLDIDSSGVGLRVVGPHASGYYLVPDASGSGFQRVAGEDQAGALILSSGAILVKP